MLQRKNFIHLLPYFYPKEPLTKRSNEKITDNFYKKIKLIRYRNNGNNILSPIKRKINLSLPKIKININSINNKTPIKKDKPLERYFSFDEKNYVKYYENAISKIMRSKPKKNLGMQSPYEALLLKGSENKRKINKIKLNKENIYYRNNVKNISSKISDSSSYINVSNSYFNKKTNN